MKIFLTFLFCCSLAFTRPLAAQKLPSTGRQQQAFIDTVPALMLYDVHLLDSLRPEEAEVRSYISDKFSIKNSGSTFHLEDTRLSPFGRHYTFRQHFNGHRIFGSEVRVHVSSHRVILVTAVVFNTNDWNIVVPDLSGLALEFSKEKGGTLRSYENVVYYDGSSPVPAVCLTFSGKGSPRLVLDAGGMILYRRDMNLYKADPGKDTIIRGYFFNPDPLTKAHVGYGAPFLDSSDAAVVAVDQQRDTATVTAWFENDTFWLFNKYTLFRDFDPPYDGKVFSLSPDFFYSRHDKMFEAFNAFVHLSRMQQRVDSLGYPALLDTLIVDPHGLSGDDNSHFDYTINPPTLAFGDGGVDDAEDADVVVHEYTHCLSFYGSPNTANGSERIAMDEGWGDYMASSYSRALDTFRYYLVYSWDGHNQFWPGRVSITPKLYPANLQGNPHLDGEIWANALMLINDRLGRDTTEKLLLASFFFQGSNMKMPQMARIVLKMDTLQYGGANRFDIYEAFTIKKILSWPVSVPEPGSAGIKLLSSLDFALGKGDAEIELPVSFSGQVCLTDVQGRRIRQAEIVPGLPVKINPGDLSPGFYFVTVTGNNVSRTFKLVRY